MSEQPGIRIRRATIDDTAFVISLIPRLTEFGPPSWRDEEKMTEIDTRVLIEALKSPQPDTAIFIAETQDRVPLGFIYLLSGADYYHHEKHGHISDIIVIPEGEGKRIGRLLIEQAEAWARSQGYRWLTLNVFAQNQRARRVYEKLGYGQDILKYVKEIH